MLSVCHCKMLITNIQKTQLWSIINYHSVTLIMFGEMATAHIIYYRLTINTYSC